MYYTISDDRRVIHLYDAECVLVAANLNTIPSDAEPMPQEMIDRLAREHEAGREERERKAVENAAESARLWAEALKPKPIIHAFGSAQADAAAERLGVVRAGEFLVDVSSEPKPEAIRDILVDGAKVFVGGMAGDGKSATALELAVSLSTGTPLFGIERFPVLNDPAPVLYIQTENDDATQRARIAKVLDARGVTEADVPLIVLPQEQALGLKFDAPKVSEDGDLIVGGSSRERVEKFAVAHGVKHIILDPLYDLIDSDMSDRDMTIRSVLKWLVTLQAHGFTVVTSMMCDPTKGIDGLFGSKYLRMHVEDMLTIDRGDVPGHPQQSDFTIRRIPKRWRDELHAHKFVLRGRGTGVWEERDKKTEPEAKADAPPRSEREAIVRESLIEFPDITVREREEKTGIPKSSLERLIKKIRAEEA